MMEYLFNQLELRQDFELTQGYMALFLKVQYIQYMVYLSNARDFPRPIPPLSIFCMFVNDIIGVLKRCQGTSETYN